MVNKLERVDNQQFVSGIFQAETSNICWFSIPQTKDWLPFFVIYKSKQRVMWFEGARSNILSPSPDVCCCSLLAERREALRRGTRERASSQILSTDRFSTIDFPSLSQRNPQSSNIKQLGPAKGPQAHRQPRQIGKVSFFTSCYNLLTAQKVPNTC